MMKDQFKYLRLLFQLVMILLALFTLARLLFLIFNGWHFETDSFREIIYLFIAGWRFDLSSIATVNALFILLLLIPFPFRSSKFYQGLLRAVFIVFNSIAFLTYCIDLEYFEIYRRRIDYPALLDNLSGFEVNYFLKSYWLPMIIWVIFTFLIFLSTKVISFQKEKIIKPLKYYSLQTLIFILLMPLVLLSIRGGLQLKPLDVINAGMYTSTGNFSLITNNPFVVIKTLDKKPVDLNAGQDAPYNPIVGIKSEGGVFKKKNVVIFVLESFSKEFIGALNPNYKHNEAYRSFTPFLDSLTGHAYVCTDAYANDENSMRSLPNILSSMPSWMKDEITNSIYTQNEIHSLASILQQKGYRTLFFHGGRNGTMNFDAYVKSVGFDRYYGLNEFPDKEKTDGKWGVYDEPFFKFFAEKLDKTRQPFLGTVFSLSSHDPYKIPEKHRGKFPEGPLPIHKSAAYVDYSLKAFFETAKTMPWYDETIFVITADHGPRWNERHMPYYKNMAGKNAIPLLFFSPADTLTGTYKKTSQQADILPSILDLLNFKGKVYSFGKNIFEEPKDAFALANKGNKGYLLIKDGYLAELENDSLISLYHIGSDSMLQKNLSGKGLADSLKMKKFATGIIQTYEWSLVNNAMTVEKFKQNQNPENIE